ncbi:hypothetical protein [Microbispora sp. NBRC 16548]|uniref:hypothetical protein n=1 Tax=Microbispora sp. NBRC 16548 TaxID=3030994 RepID=UPI0017E7E894|nr:hypothetical protein [Microbispora sp. NBRC 16548]
MIVIGAQAIYLHTARSPVALAETTKDSDLALDPRVLEDEPLLEQSMSRAGFYRDPIGGQPGAWLNSEGIPVDLMVPEALAGPGAKNTRGARIPPHDRRATRRARAAFNVLLSDPISSEITDQAVGYLAALFAPGPDALGARMAGRAEEGIGEPETVALATSLLAADLAQALQPG